MDDKSGQGKSKPRPKYVWDPKKLTWVEAVEEETEEVSVEPEVSDVEDEGEVEAAAEPVAEATGEEASAAEPVNVPDTEVAAVEAPEEEEASAVLAERRMVEAVEVEEGELEYKGALGRLGAFIVDGAILLLVMWLVGKATGGGISLNAAVETAEGTSSSYWWAMPVIFLLYFVGFWTWRGQTPGKMLFKAKIVKKDGGRIGVIRAFVRFIIYFAYLIVWAVLGGSILVFVLILIVLLFIIGLSKKKRGLHDLIAGTVVVSARSGISQSEFVKTSEISEPETDKQG